MNPRPEGRTRQVAPRAEKILRQHLVVTILGLTGPDVALTNPLVVLVEIRGAGHWRNTNPDNPCFQIVMVSSSSENMFRGKTIGFVEAGGCVERNNDAF